MLAYRATAQIEVWVKHIQWYNPVGEGGACVERSQWERGGRGRGLCLRANRALQASMIFMTPVFKTSNANSALSVKIGVMNIINSNSGLIDAIRALIGVSEYH